MKDLIILGNGMAGMTAALYAKRANLDFKIVGRDEYDFGQIGNAILVENFPCAESQSGFDLAMKLHDQLVANEIEIEEHEVKEVLQESDETFSIKYEDGTFDYARTIIYALGARHRELNCEIEEGVPIHYCALCDGALYKDKTVAVIGGGDVAFTQAEYLSQICKEVEILMCDDKVTAAPKTYERVKKISNIHIYFNCPVTKLSHQTISDGPYWIWCEGVRGPIFADGIFVAIGMIPNTKPLEHLMSLDEGHITCYADYRALHCANLIAAGDVRRKLVHQALTAASDGAIAVDTAARIIKYSKYKSDNK